MKDRRTLPPRTLIILCVALLASGCQGAARQAPSAVDDLGRVLGMSTNEVGPLLDDTLARGAAASRDDAASAALTRMQKASVTYEAIPPDVRSATCDVVGDWVEAKFSGQPFAEFQATEAVAQAVAGLNKTTAYRDLAQDLSAELSAYRDGEPNTLAVLLLKTAVCAAA